MDGDAQQQEITRLKNEVHAKEETLNQLKLKTKSFVDNLRQELAGEKKKVSDLEEQLKHAKDSVPSSSGGTHSNEEVEALKKEIANITHHENELKVRAKTFADSMKAQLQVEKDKTHKLEKELQDKTTELAAAKAATATPSHDLLGFGGSHTDADIKQKDDEIAALKTQLQHAQHEIVTMRDQVRRAEEHTAKQAQESAQTKQTLENLRISSEQQIARLQAELGQIRNHEHDLESTLQTQKSAQGNVEAAFAQEHGQLEAALSRSQELAHQIQQYKIENEHLQKQLVDKDFLLEQLDNYRQRADDNEDRANKLQGEVAALTARVLTQEQESAKACAKCDDLKRELSEMSTLYEKVNMGRSQSDLQLAEAQTALNALQTVKQNYDSVQARMEEVTKQSMQLNEKIFQKESEVTSLKSDVQRLTAEVAQLNQRLNASKSDSFSRKQQSDALEADKKKAEDALREVQAKAAALEKKNQELASSVEAVTKDSNEKRQKAKALVVSLTNEKQGLVDAKSDLQKEVDRLRMELNQKNVENERRLKQIQDENQQRIAQSTSNVQNLNDEIGTLKQTLLLIQESERNQQRAKELANAKREVEDSNKKRLAAKAETQKLAVELETVQKCLNQLAESAASTCNSSGNKIAHLQDRVNEALDVLEKRAAASGKKPPSSPKSSSRDVEVEDLRVPESVSRPMSPTSGAKKVEDNIARLTEKLTAFMEVTEKLCDLSIEQNDVNLKDVVIDKFSQMFTQCFSEKLRAAYSKVEDVENNLMGGKS